MRLLLTGLNGTLAPHLAKVAHAQGVDVVGWNRATVSPDDAQACRAWLTATQPDAIAHLAMGSEDWAAVLAMHAAERSLPFVFTSTAMVFHHEPGGPHAPHGERTAQDDYGRYKMRCEDTVLAANPYATIARIGWQIDTAAQGNNMLAALDAWQAREGAVRASTRWRPACSFMCDTAAALLALLLQPEPGVVQLDSNVEEGWRFDEMALALQQRFDRAGWQVVADSEGYAHDQRLLPRLSQGVRLPPLSAQLGLRPAEVARGPQ